MDELQKELSETIEKVAKLLNAEVEQQGKQILVKKKRILEIQANNRCFNCQFDHDISFEDFQKSGIALNKAQIFLLPEESFEFLLSIREHPIPFPPYYRQWKRINPHIVSICLESMEPPEHFAERLSSALSILEQAPFRRKGAKA